MRRLHICPIGDIKEHRTDSPDCWCEPVLTDDLVIHNAADGREFFEDEERELILNSMRNFPQSKPIAARVK